jgi:hypothetical protein
LLGNPLKANTSAIFYLRSYGYDAKNELRPGFQAITNHFTRYFILLDKEGKKKKWKQIFSFELKPNNSKK